MLRHLPQANELAAGDRLEPGLQALVDGGLVLSHGALLLSRNLQRNVHLINPDDPTSTEAAINEVHLEDYVHTPDWIVKCVSQGILLAKVVLDRARRLTNLDVEAIVAVRESGPDILPSSTFRFYCLRPSDRWIADDIDLYEEAILVVR